MKRSKTKNNDIDYIKLRNNPFEYRQSIITYSNKKINSHIV